MDQTDRDYYRSRADEEEVAAGKATTLAAALAHRDLATRYRARFADAARA